MGFRLCLSALLMLLAGCAATPPIPHPLPGLELPRRLLVQEMPGATLWQVVVQQQGQGLRFLRFNLLGIPDARQILQDGHWQNDGFIAPNAKARELFAALLFAFTDTADLPLAYTHAVDSGNKRELTENGRPRWTIIWQERPAQPDVFSIENHTDGIVWQIRPML